MDSVSRRLCDPRSTQLAKDEDEKLSERKADVLTTDQMHLLRSGSGMLLKQD